MPEVNQAEKMVEPGFEPITGPELVLGQLNIIQYSLENPDDAL